MLLSPAQHLANLEQESQPWLLLQQVYGGEVGHCFAGDTVGEAGGQVGEEEEMICSTMFVSLTKS